MTRLVVAGETSDATDAQFQWFRERFPCLWSEFSGCGNPGSWRKANSVSVEGDQDDPGRGGHGG